MVGESFQVEHLCAGSAQVLQQPALAAAGGSADHAPNVARRQRLERLEDGASVGPISTVELARVPADALEHVDQGAAALAAAPAVHERAPRARLVRERLVEMACDVACDQCSADAAGVEGRAAMQRTDLCALAVVQHRQVHRQRHVVFGEFARTAHVDDGVVRRRRTQRGVDVDDVAFHPCPQPPLRASSGRNCGQTRSSIRCWALSFGWMRSARKKSILSAKPSKKKGTRAAFSLRARSA